MSQVPLYLAPPPSPPPEDTSVALCLGPYDGPEYPGGGAFLCARHPCSATNCLPTDTRA